MSHAEWPSMDWPVALGEYPCLVTAPKAYRNLDAEMALLRTKLADTQAELANLFPALIDTNRANMLLAGELQQAMSEVHQLRDEIAKANVRIDELTQERDDARATMPRGLG